MFGFFNKKREVKTPPEEVGVIAEGAKGILSMQLALADCDETALLASKFALGYTTGVIDAIAQRRGVPEGEHVLVLAAVYALLWPSRPEVAAAVMRLGPDSEFSAGQLAGGQETLSLLSKRIEVANGLLEHLKSN